jgi:flagellin-specific chaperone FliS
MVGKVIEKAYKYTIPTPQEPFQMFQEKFSKAMLPDSWQVSEPWTNTVLTIFDEIGRNMGYTPRKEYLRLDQTWEIRLPDISTIVLALEYENTDRVEEILNDELQKLLDVKALLKVLIFYPLAPAMMYEGEFTIPEIQEKIRSAKIKNPDERYIVMNLVYSKSQSIIEVLASSLDSEGKGEDLGSFQVKYTSKD